jgi:hypothetical protein
MHCGQQSFEALVPSAMPTDDEQVLTLARGIEHYLEKHPNAADSLEGIRRWWLIRHRYAEDKLQVERALELLIAEGIVVRRILPDGRAVYSGRKAESNQGL